MLKIHLFFRCLTEERELIFEIISIAAVGSGFDMIGGNAIHPAVARPECVYRFEARNLPGKLSA